MNILIIKIGALGDVVRSTFIAQALRDKYRSKKPRIFWLTQEPAGHLFINSPYVNSLVFLKDKEKLKKVPFDLIVNLEEDLETVEFASSLKHKNFVGFEYKNGKVAPTPTIKEWFNMSAIGPRPQNDILKRKNKKSHRQILSEIINIKDHKKYEPFLRLTPGQRKLAEDFLRRHNLSRNEVIIGLNTGSADRWPKHLSTKKTAKLIDLLQKKFNAKILLFGGPKEINRNKEIHRLSKAPLIDTGCGNNLIEFPALISVCSIFITTDSLGLHIALALKRKTISLIGPTSSTEIDMYGLGEKIIADSKCLCCYKKDCKSMEKINLNKIIPAVEKLINQKVVLLINAFKEPNVGKSIEAALNQKTIHPYTVILSAPDKETLEIAHEYAKKHKNLKIFKDPGKGKSYAINLLLPKIDTDILILTDGDVFISEDTVENIANLFFDPEVGCVTGRPVPVETRKTKYGYWANFLFSAAHNLRSRLYKNQSFIECSGYLFAFRKEKITRFPIDVAEDTIIPYFLWEKGYKIGYAENAKVYVKNPDNWNDWIKQKVRTAKSHENIGNYVDVKTTPKVKTLKTEFKGVSYLIRYPKSLKEYFWTVELALSRLYMWGRFYLDKIFGVKRYTDAWERVESTK